MFRETREQKIALCLFSLLLFYYVTFEVESGDRMELHVPGREYGQLAEGDKGKLSFQGTRYLGFERRR